MRKLIIHPCERTFYKLKRKRRKIGGRIQEDVRIIPATRSDSQIISVFKRFVHFCLTSDKVNRVWMKIEGENDKSVIVFQFEKHNVEKARKAIKDFRMFEMSKDLLFDKKYSRKKNTSKKQTLSNPMKPKPKHKVGEDCIITQACCAHFGLSDDCKQLTMLRKFRDNYILKRKKGGVEIIQKYYEVCPDIINRIEEEYSPVQQMRIYHFIKTQIDACCDLLKKRKLRYTYINYCTLINYLKNNIILSIISKKVSNTKDGKDVILHIKTMGNLLMIGGLANAISLALAIGYKKPKTS